MKKTTITLFIASLFFAISCQKSEIGSPKSKTKNAKAAVSAITEIVPLNGSAMGHTYKQIEEKYAQWILGVSFDDSPLSDLNGAAFEASKQPIPGIMILSSNFGGESIRSATIPAGSYIYLPIFGGTAWKYSAGVDECDPSKVPDGHPLNNATNAILKSYINQQKASGLIAQVDDMDIIPDLTKNLVVTDPFQMEVHSSFNNPACDYTGKIATAVAMDFAVMVKLEPGPHIIRFSGLSNNKKFYSGVTWNIVVE
jgi:hypothetical protein